MTVKYCPYCAKVIDTSDSGRYYFKDLISGPEYTQVVLCKDEQDRYLLHILTDCHSNITIIETSVFYCPMCGRWLKGSEADD